MHRFMLHFNLFENNIIIWGDRIHLERDSESGGEMSQDS